MRGKRVLLKSSIAPNIGTLPLAWEKEEQTYTYVTGRGNTPTCVGKRFARMKPEKIRQEHSHSRGKKLSTWIPFETLSGILPLTWEKESVFMRLSKVFAAICMKKFYKYLALFLPAAMFPLSYHKAYSFRFLCKENCYFTGLFSILFTSNPYTLSIHI